MSITSNRPSTSTNNNFENDNLDSDFNYSMDSDNYFEESEHENFSGIDDSDCSSNVNLSLVAAINREWALLDCIDQITLSQEVDDSLRKIFAKNIFPASSLLTSKMAEGNLTYCDVVDLVKALGYVNDFLVGPWKDKKDIEELETLIIETLTLDSQ